MSRIAALVFDAYGTLFDVHAVVRRCEDFWPGRGEALSRLWRQKQLEYTWQRSLMGRYADFERVTADALGHAAQALALGLGDAQREALLAAYRTLDTFAEVPAVLARLGERRLAILSNGSPAMLNAAVAHAGLAARFEQVISVDALRIYKPAPAVYRLAADRLGLPPASIGFVSSNGWDAAGAKAFGFRAFWINRAGAPADALDAPPDCVLSSLSELPGLLA